MSKLNLNDHSDSEIVGSLINLPAGKFFAVMNGLSAITNKLEKRGKIIAQEQSDEEINKIIRTMFEGDK